MSVHVTWKDGIRFLASESGHEVEMDGKPPVGADSAMSPKKLLLAAICGCTGMDVVVYLKKVRQPPESFEMEAEGPQTEGTYPTVFKEVRLKFKLKGKIDPSKAIEAVKLSQTKYCGVSAMVSKAAPIFYTVELNGETIGTGQADFA